MQQVINNTQAPRFPSQSQENDITPLSRSIESPRTEHAMQLPSALIGNTDDSKDSKGKFRDQLTEKRERSNYSTASTANSNSAGFSARFMNRPKSSSLNRDSNINDRTKNDTRRDFRDESREKRDDRQRDRLDNDSNMDLDRNQDGRKLSVSSAGGIPMNFLQAAHLIAATSQQSQQLQIPANNALSLQIPSAPAAMMSTANVSGQLQASNLFPPPANILSFPNIQANVFDQNQQDMFVQQQRFQQQQQKQLATISALTQPGYLLTEATGVPPLSAMLLDDSEKIIDYRQLLIMGQISHQLIRQVFQTPITPLDIDPSSSFSAPLAISLSHQQRLQQLSQKYSDNLDRLHQELAGRNATLGLTRELWEKLAKRQYVEISQFHPDRLLETAPLPKNIRVQLTPDQDGNLRLSFIDEGQNPLSALAQTFGNSSLLSATSPQQQQIEIFGFAGWLRAWNRYTIARTILFSEDFTQLKQYALNICGFAEQYRWSNVQRFDNARRTVHAADTRDLLTNDIPTIRAQCLVPEARLDTVPNVQAQAFLDSIANNKPNETFQDRNQLSIKTSNVPTTSYASPRSANSSYRPDYRSPVSPSFKPNVESQSSYNRSRVNVPKPKTSASGRIIPQSGSINNIQICGEFNGRRGCARKHCSYLHICAVCAGTNHGRSTCAGKSADPYPVPAASVRRNEEKAASPKNQTAQDQGGWRLML